MANSLLAHLLIAMLPGMIAGCGTGGPQSEPSLAANPGTPSAANASIEPFPTTRSALDSVSSPLTFIPPALTEEEIRSGWISLFDGATLYGWELPAESGWEVQDGCIVNASGAQSLLLTAFRFDDFELRCDFHLAAGGNSGLFLRTAETVSDPATDTYELNLCDSHPEYGTGSLVGRYVTPDVPVVEGGWHTFRVRCQENRIQVWLDGIAVVDFSDTSDAVLHSGRIGLQRNVGRIAFRNIFLRPLNSQELFNGKDLAGWRVVPSAGDAAADSSAMFAVADGLIQVTGGPGFLETEGTYGNFVLHVESRTNGDSLNSGVFFRAQPGTADAPSNGYEMQIHNGFRDGDRSQPVDFGTGAIFRRMPARYIVASDREWFTQTLIAQDDHFATWVNGYQVVSWLDTRDSHVNPRQGRRRDPGHFSLQAHDSTTDLNFRSVRLHQLQ